LSAKKKSRSKILEIKSKMLMDKLKGKKIIILDIEETTFIPYILPIVRSLKRKTEKISYYIATHYEGNEDFKAFEVPAAPTI
jgi:hypothetical protein